MAGTGVALAALGAGTGRATSATAATATGKVVQVGDRRKLGSLEVSAVGLGVQNMHRTYQTIIPDRAEMIRIIGAVHDRGVTLFDTAEAYGPFEDERILGEAVQPFRKHVVIASKFGWNIDPDGKCVTSAPLNSQPDHIKRAVEGSLLDENPGSLLSSNQHAVLMQKHRLAVKI